MRRVTALGVRLDHSQEAESRLTFYDKYEIMDK